MKQPRSCCKLYKFCSFTLTNSSNMYLLSTFNFVMTLVQEIMPVYSRIMFCPLILGSPFLRWVFLIMVQNSGRSLRVSELALDTTNCLYIELIVKRIHLISVALKSTNPHGRQRTLFHHLLPRTAKQKVSIKILPRSHPFYPISFYFPLFQVKFLSSSSMELKGWLVIQFSSYPNMQPKLGIIIYLFRFCSNHQLLVIGKVI